MSLSYRLVLSCLFLMLLSLSFAQAYTSNDYYKAGITYYSQQDFPKAIAYLKWAAQLDANNWKANQVLGYAYYKSGDYANAVTAFEKSLQVNPNNPSLKSFDDLVRAKAGLGTSSVSTAPAPPPVTTPSALPPLPARSSSLVYISIPDEFRKNSWLNFHLGAIYATLGDMPNAASVFNSSIPSSVTHGATIDQLGFLIGAESGWSFDPENAIGCSVDFGLFGGYKDSATNGPNTGSDSFQPTMIAVELKYYHSFLMGNSRFRVGIGPGIYVTNLSVSEVLNDTSVVSGNMVGGGFGGALDLGWETVISNQFTFNATLRCRYASTSNIQGTATDPNGNSEPIGFDTTSQGYMGVTPTSNIGSYGIRWAKIDYTGADGLIGFSFHY